MKRLNRKIALLALTSLLAVGNSMANELTLPSTSSAAGKSSYLIKGNNSEKWGASKLFLSPKLIDTPLFIARCTLIDPRNGKKNTNGVLCKDGTCVTSANLCPDKKPSPSYKEINLNDDGI